MNFDLTLFSNKLNRYCSQYLVNANDISLSTGISREQIEHLMSGNVMPTGDEILILADYFKCDFKFFISNQQLAPFEQTEELFRRHGNELNREDRWSIQEFLFLCECQDFIFRKCPQKINITPFKFKKTGDSYKQHGKEAAIQLRKFFNYKKNAIPINVFDDFRKLGIHIFRRKLNQSAISGIYIRHPNAGHCILINYDEDIYRQRFSVAHEAAHAILDNNEVSITSKEQLQNTYKKWSHEQLSEIRANIFAASYLAPDEFLHSIPEPSLWNNSKIIEYAKMMHINPKTLAIALKNANLISETEKNKYSDLKIKKIEKEDSELSNHLSIKGRERKLELLKKGLSSSYVDLCFTAYREEIISLGRLAEILLCNGVDELFEICELYNIKINYGN